MGGRRELAALILGAGQGKRMRSQLPKVIHPVCGQPMIRWVMSATEGVGIIDRIIVVVGFKAEMVRQVVGDRAECVLQREQLGTGHAVLQAEPLLKDSEGDLLILYGDTPLLTSQALRRFIRFHQDEEACATVLTTFLSNPTGYGRIIRDGERNILRIVEERDSTTDEKRICEINTGILCVRIRDLFPALHMVTCRNAQGEYYLTDVIGILRAEGKAVRAFLLEESEEAMGVNTLEELAQAERIMKRRLESSALSSDLRREEGE